MARLSLAGHWKFRRLVRALAGLGEPEQQLTAAVTLARGLLELLWESGYNATSDYIGTPTDLAEVLHWRGDPLVLVTLLRDAGFIDERGPSEFVIHDFWAHCPPYVTARWTRTHPGQTPPWQNAESKGRKEILDDASEGRREIHRSHVQGKGRDFKEKSSAAGAARSLEWNEAVLVPLGYELVRQGKRFDSDADLKEALKNLAVRYGIAYDADSVTRALDALKHAQAPLWFSQGKPS